MKQFTALLKLQLLSRFADLKPRNWKSRFSEKKGKAIGMAILYVVLILYLAGLVVYVENALLNVLIRLGMPDMILTIACVGAMLSTLILAFFFIMSSLYFSKDTAFIASLPIKSRTVLAAKMAQIWLSETGVSALFMLPACILYGIKTHPDVLFYLRMILIWAAIAVLPIVLVAFLSTLLIRLSALWKKREMVATVGGIMLLVAYMIVCMNLGSIAGDDPEAYLMELLTNHMARIKSLSRLFPPAGWAARGLMGDWGQLVLFLFVSLATFAFAVWVIGMWYHNLSLMQSETSATRSKHGKKAVNYTVSSAFQACCRREIKQIFRVPAYATNILPISFMPVLMVGVMALSLSRAMAQEGDTLAMLLENVSGGTVLAVMAALMSFMAGMNPALSSAVTREGKGHDALTALPVPFRTVVLAKLAVGMGLSVIGCIPAAVILSVLLPGYGLHAFLAFIATVLYCYVSGCVALSNDVSHPKFDWLTETEAIKQKSGTLIGILVSWALLGLLAVISIFVLEKGFSTFAYAALLILLLLAAAFTAHRFLLHTADQKYWQG